jgi:hypothetical protein
VNALQVCLCVFAVAFGAVAAGTVTWTIAGAVLLTLLFVGSTIFTESITRDRAL